MHVASSQQSLSQAQLHRLDMQDDEVLYTLNSQPPANGFKAWLVSCYLDLFDRDIVALIRREEAVLSMHNSGEEFERAAEDCLARMQVSNVCMQVHYVCMQVSYVCMQVSYACMQVHYVCMHTCWCYTTAVALACSWLPNLNVQVPSILWAMSCRL